LQKRNQNNGKISNLSNFDCGAMSNRKADEPFQPEEYILSELKQKLAMTDSVLQDTSAKLGSVIIDIFQYVFANIEI